MIDGCARRRLNLEKYLEQCTQEDASQKGAFPGAGVSAMGIKTHPIEPHWNYLLALERDLELISRYIEFDERNSDCFSLELARVLLAAAAEVDIVCKQICVMLDGGPLTTRSSTIVTLNTKEQISRTH